MGFDETDYRQIEQSADALVREEQGARTSMGLAPLSVDLEARLKNVFLAYHLLSKTGHQEATLTRAAETLYANWNARWQMYQDQDYEHLAKMALAEQRRRNRIP